MTMMNSVNPDMEDLEHHGVKGMHWGQRRARPSSSDIKSARKRLDSSLSSFQRQDDKTNASKGKEHDKNAATLAKMEASFLKNPDRATALRMTKGEKALTAILTVAVPPAGLAVVGVRVGARKAVERSVRKNAPLKAEANFSSVTKSVIKDHNNMTDRQFLSKYAVTKNRYAKRVAKGDPNPTGRR